MIFCFTIFHNILFKKLRQQACSMPLSGIHFHIHLFYPFILMPYGIMGDFRSEQEEKRFTYCYTKMKKLRISWLILAPKISLAFTFIFKAFSYKICSQWQDLQLMHSCRKKPFFFEKKFFETIIHSQKFWDHFSSPQFRCCVEI